MRKKHIVLVVILLILQLTSCKDVPPIIPGLTQSRITLSFDPDSAAIYFNERLAGNKSPFIMSDLEPGYYRIDLVRPTYLDTTINYLIKRGASDSIFVQLLEDPRYWWKNYSMQNAGFPTNSLTKIRIDNQNNIWIGTSFQGLIKFNGATFSVYNKMNSGIPGNLVNDILIDNNTIWVATNQGMGRFDGSNWTIYNSLNSPIPNDYITSLTLDHNHNLWAGTESGIIKFDGITFTSFDNLNSGIPSNYIYAIYADQNNAIWAGTWGDGVCKFDGQKWTVYSTSNSLLQDDYISSIAADNSGMIWVGSGTPGVNDYGTGGISYFKDSQWYNFNRYNSGFPGRVVTEFLVDRSNHIWAGTDGGLAKYDGKKWTKYTVSNSGLADNSVVSISIDSDQNKWCTSIGVSEYTGGK